MAITKTLILASLAVMALGAGPAMADGPDGLNPDIRSARTLAAAMNAARNASHAGQVQSGAASILNHHMIGAEGSGGWGRQPAEAY